MIDLIERLGAIEKQIADYIKCRIDGYYSSDCYTVLDNKMRTMQDCADLIPSANKYNEWQSNVSFPIVKERQLLRRAITSANYRAPDIYSLTPLGGTPYENAAFAETLLNLNMQKVRFREKTLKPIIDTASKFGSFVTYTYWKRGGKPKIKTIYKENTGQYERVQMQDEYVNAYTCQIDLRDYFQNPEIADTCESDFQGHRRRVHVSELVLLLNDPLYLKENVQKALEQARSGQIKAFAASNDKREDYTKYDDKRHYVDICRWEGMVNIKENEDDSTMYVIEMIGDIIIRISREDYDEDIRSYTVGNFDKRYNRWYGTSDSEYVVTHENYLNTILGQTLDSAMRSMQQYVFFEKEKISQGDLNNVFRNNGFVPVDANNVPISQLVHAFQPGRLDMSNAQFAINAVNQSVQQMSTKVDLSRTPNQGGLNNNTATAANIIAGQSDVLESDILENIDFGIVNIGYVTLILMQQFLPSVFYMRPKPKESEQEILKYMIMGSYDYRTQTTMQKNKAGELLRLQNLFTWWLNVNQNPALAQLSVNLVPLLKEIWNKADVPSDEIMPSEQKATATPGMIPSNQQQAMVGGGMIPMQGDNPALIAGPMTSGAAGGTL